MNLYLDDIKLACETLETFHDYNNISEVDNKFLEQEGKFYSHLKEFYFPRLRDCGLHKNQEFFRVTKVYPGIKEERVSEFYNPPSCKTPYGRCNYKFYPMFYLSTNPIGAFSEVIREKLLGSTIYYLSKWTCNYNSALNATIFLQGQKLDNPRWENAKEVYFDMVRTEFSSIAGSDISEILSFVADNFLNSCDYRLSSFLSHQLLYGVPSGSDYVVYPSVREKYASVNFAFSPRLIQNNAFILDRVWKFSISDFEMNDSSVDAKWRVESCFVSPDGLNLVWTDDFDKTFLKTYLDIG